jgi:hypothetical protein
VLSKINNISKTLIISGLSLSVVNVFTLDNDWLDMGGFSMAMIGFLLSKKDFVESGDDYGIYQYYTIIGLYIIILFLFWFS